MMSRVVCYMTEAKTFLGGLTGWNGLINDALAKVAAFRAAAPAKLRGAAADLQKRLLDTLAVGMSRIQRKATKNAEPHVVRQEKMAPPTRTPQWTAKQVAGRKVYQRDDLIDPDYVSPETGLSNRELMESGQAPIGPDGRPINLHHTTQDEPVGA